MIVLTTVNSFTNMNKNQNQKNKVESKLSSTFNNSLNYLNTGQSKKH